MEDFLKDFEYYGFESELHMMNKIVIDATDYPEAIKNKSFNEIMNYWFDNNVPNSATEEPVMDGSKANF